MKLIINVEDTCRTGLKKGAAVFVKKVRNIGDKIMYGVKSPRRGLVWYAQNEVIAK